MDKSSKESKESKQPKTPTSQEQPSPTTTGTPDWTGFQPFSPFPPGDFLASSPQPHPYMWGVQHIMPPYGTPPHPYVAMYPPGGIYVHPSMPPVNTTGNTEVEGKPSEGKEKLPIKRSKGSLRSLNMITGRNNEPGKTSGASANGGYSKSGESASKGSDANSQNLFVANQYKPSDIVNILVANRSKLIRLLAAFKIDKEDESFEADKAQVVKEISELQATGSIGNYEELKNLCC